MQNLDMKILKRIAIAIVAILGILMFIIAKLTIPPKVEEEVILEASNNNERVIHYNGQIYCTTKIKNNGKIKDVLLRLPIDFDDSTPRELLKTFSTSVEDIKLNFFENKLIYKDSGTYIYDFQKNKNALFCDGELQFLFKPDGFVMLQSGNLYKATYYESTYMAKTIEEIAIGEFKRIGEDNENVYYFSTSGQSNIVIVSLNKNTLKLTTLDNINVRKQSLEAAEATDDYIYAFFSSDSEKYIRRISKKLDKNGNPEIEKIPIELFDKIEPISLKYTKPINFGKSRKKEKFNDLYFYGSKIIEQGYRYGKETVYEKKLYKYSFEQNSVTEYTGILNELYTGSYSGDFNGTVAQIYYGDKKITEIDTKIQGLNELIVTDVNIIEHDKKQYLYYEIRVSEIVNEESENSETTSNGKKVLKNSDVILARTLLEGGPSQKINIK